MKTHQLLIVEDNEDTQELLCAQLESPRFQIAAVSDGQQAILSVGESPPDLVIMDIMMPQLDGLETSRYFKLRFQGNRPPPILVLSAKHDAASRQTAAEYGCEDYIDKPHSRQRLEEAVETLLELADLESGLAAGGVEDDSIDRIIELRMALAARQHTEQSHGIAKAHLERVLELRPEHEAARAMHERLARLTAAS